MNDSTDSNTGVKQWFWMGMLLLVVGLALIAPFLSLELKVATTHKQYVAAAEITGKQRKPNRHSADYLIAYTYEVNGRYYPSEWGTTQKAVWQKYSAGDKITVYVSPEYPEKSYWPPSRQMQRFESFLGYAFGSLIFSIGIAILLGWAQNRGLRVGKPFTSFPVRLAVFVACLSVLVLGGCCW